MGFMDKLKARFKQNEETKEISEKYRRYEKDKRYLFWEIK